MGIVTATLTSNGKKLDPKYQVIALDISREINKIPDARIILIDGSGAQQKFEIADSDFFVPGKEIEIKLRYESDAGKEATVFKGNVLKQIISADQEGFLLTVELRHKAFNLTTVRKNSVFADTDDKAVVSTIFKNAGMKATCSIEAAYKHKQLVQYYCSDWDFILSRADANGCGVIAGDDEVLISPIKDLEGKSKKGKVVFGLDEVYEFEWESNAGSQVEKVRGTAWDIKKQTLTPLKASQGFAPAFGNLKGEDLGKKINADYLLMNCAQVDEKEIEAWTNAKMIKSRMSLFRGKISIKGRADYLPGGTVVLEGMGNRFKGKALISGIRHRVDQEGWVLDIQFGLSPDGFSQSYNIMEKPAMGLMPGIHGLQVGVIDKFEEDKDKHFRVRVKVPAFKSKAEGIVWARLITPYAGKERGIFFFPEEGDEVILGFFNDDPRQAVILGSVYSSTNTIPKTFKSSKENIDKGIVMKNGARLSFKDDKKSVIELETPEKNKVTIDDANKTIVIIDQNKNKIELNNSGITIKSAKDIVLDAGGNVTIKGKKVDIK